MKYSKQRDLILDYIVNSSEHPTAEMVYKHVKKTIPNISLGTVYRNLKVLCENNMIRKIVDVNKIDRFDNVKNNHCHLQCLKCHKLIDIDEHLSNEASALIQTTTKHDIVSHQMMFIGICNDCKK